MGKLIVTSRTTEPRREWNKNFLASRKSSETTHMRKCWKKETDTSRLKWVE